MASIAFQLTIDQQAATQIGLDLASKLVIDTTRRVFNRANVLTPVDTGNLRRGNQMRVQRQATRVVGEVFNDVEYARAVHDGTRAHIIRPSRKKALKFTVDGVTVFARQVRHPGTRARPWLAQALQEIAPQNGFTVET